MKRQLAKIPFFGVLARYHCDGCGRRRLGREDRPPRRWAEHPFSHDELDPEASTVIHECRPCGRAWAQTRLEIADASRRRPAEETGGGDRADGGGTGGRQEG